MNTYVYIISTYTYINICVLTIKYSTQILLRQRRKKCLYRIIIKCRVKYVAAIYAWPFYTELNYTSTSFKLKKVKQHSGRNASIYN